MFDYRTANAAANAACVETLSRNAAKIATIANQCDYELKKDGNAKQNFFEYFRSLSRFFLDALELEKHFTPDQILSMSFDDLLARNARFYNETVPQNYNTSFCNPQWAVHKLGDKYGQLLSNFYSKCRNCIEFAAKHELWEFAKKASTIVDAYEYVLFGNNDYNELKAIMLRDDIMPNEANILKNLAEKFNPQHSYFRDILTECDLEDLRYLFLYDDYISQHEIKMAQFFSKQPPDKINILAKRIVDAFFDGFIVDGKDFSKKKNVVFYYNIGMEKLAAAIVRDFAARGKEVIVNTVFTARLNPQYAYDHKFDNSLYLSAEWVQKYVEFYEKACTSNAELLRDYAGPLYFDTFGEPPFSPVSKPENLKLSEEQTEITRNFQNATMLVQDKYIARTETSFCIVGFPTPEIGEKFEDIFRDIMEINMLDSAEYKGIQQSIIDALDCAQIVEVVGTNGNRTNLQVVMQTLVDRTAHTNFVNCGADVNIPVGEVFTSPQLKGTNGILHMKNVFLEGFTYKDLVLRFENGFIAEYSCANFDDPEEGKRFVAENLLFPHETLPIGEFAIGTNTLAYVVSRKYDIVDILPILIVEKMGPHFAIGDTCFSREEDRAVFNPNGKEITARDNEKSILRKETPEEAYTYVHTDITLPYDEIARITALCDDGKSIDIICDGRFVLAGTEKLNEPFNN